ncbi:MAG TPA: LytTR family DNA-binding domain-containing protein [Casimicrobiaceae bacterium]|nr:LytTR family DNA-binding domain-containing protein [Casimicrobiaceae bacterium]
MQEGPKAVIAEDEPVLLAELRDTLHRLWPELVVVAEAADGVEAVRALETHAPQILFLDIQMPGMTGLEVARQASGHCHVVFVTAYDKYAVAAFEEGAVDYVMKPFSAARLATTVGRLKDKLRNVPANLDGILKRLADQAGQARDYVRWITASQGNELRLITVDEVCYFQADNKYTLVVTPHQESLIRRPIKELVDELDPAVFWQIHRGTLVNVNAVAGVTRDIGGHLRVRLKERKETLPVSDPYVHRFKQM